MLYRLKDHGIHREDKVVCFGQLLGMCDHISFPLGMLFITLAFEKDSFDSKLSNTMAVAVAVADDYID